MHNIAFKILLPALATCLALFSPILAQESILFDQQKVVRYENRLSFYLDHKTKDYLIETAAKERALLENLKNLTLEVQQRGTTGIRNDDAGFNTVYGDMEKTAQSYAAELDAVLVILDEINALAATLKQEKRNDLYEQFTDLKDELNELLESRELYKKSPNTGTYKRGLVKEYNAEVDSVLRLYNQLEEMERRSRSKGDTVATALIAEQKRQVRNTIPAQSIKPEWDLDLTKSRMYEASQFLEFTKGLDKLKAKQPKSLQAAIDFETERRQTVARLDSNLIKLFGYSFLYEQEKITLDEAFRSWRAERNTEFELKKTQYDILRQKLLQSGTLRERSRMLNRDLGDALLNYAAERYLAAEMQFDTILRFYGSYFSNWDAVKFYRCEGLFARSIYPEANQEYERLLQEYPSSRFRNLTLLRLLSIAHNLHWRDRFDHYYHILDSLGTLVPSKILNRAHYLAGHYWLTAEEHGKADTALAKITSDSKYALAARYLRGTAQVRLGNSLSAIALFREFAGNQALPWSDPGSLLIRNNALLKLGYLHYQRNEFAEAVKYFDQVSRGAEVYDQSLLGMAWAQMKQGELDNAIVQANNILSGYLVSDYTYEALVLSAHCKRLLEQPQAAMRDLRYVTNARGILEVSKGYHEERRKIVEQLNELDAMENTALERQDRALYELIAKAKQVLQAALLNFNFEGPQGNLLVDEFDDERRTIFEQIQQFDEVIANAQAMGMQEELQNAVKRRNRLVKTLETYQADRAMHTINYLVEYPLAIKESGAAYRRQVVDSLMADMQGEQERLRASLDETVALLQSKTEKPFSSTRDLEMLQQDLTNLKYRLDRFQTWLSSYEVEEVNSDFDRWADVSGFGLSDLTIREIDRRDHLLDEYARNVGSIDRILKGRKQELEARLQQFDTEVRRIEEILIEQQVNLDRLERKTYFENSYFDISESEFGGNRRSEAPLRENAFPR